MERERDRDRGRDRGGPEKEMVDMSTGTTGLATSVSRFPFRRPDVTSTPLSSTSSGYSRLHSQKDAAVEIENGDEEESQEKQY